ncbi:MAG: hypothetical protein Q9219_006839 [cf. Caloplaca sp. 3 TL-2023]
MMRFGSWAKGVIDEMFSGGAVWTLVEKDTKRGGATYDPVLTPHAARQRSTLARETSAQRKKEAAEKAQRRADQEAYRESQRRSRDGNDPSFATNIRQFRPRRPSGLSKSQSQFEAQPRLISEQEVPTLAKDKKSDVELKALPQSEPAGVRAADKPAARISAAKDGKDEIHATKPAVDMTNGESEIRKDSGQGSSNRSSLEPSQRVGTLQVKKKVSIASSRYSQPGTATIVDPASNEDERQEEAVTVGATAAAMG